MMVHFRQRPLCTTRLLVPIIGCFSASILSLLKEEWEGVNREKEDKGGKKEEERGKGGGREEDRGREGERYERRGT